MAQARAAQLAQQGLPPLPALSTVPRQARWNVLVQQAQWALQQQVCREMEGYAEARSEQWQESERGQSFEERWQAVQKLLESLEQLRESAASP